ncbi:MAG: DUF3971 domain-containing protein [Proteobacteria bacterium]|nr:DUF3971 domain-containing protein [Pseudomonadota bacterium]
MFISILKRVYQQVLLLVVVALVLLAAYVSAGRQFMPAVSSYVEFFEQQIYELSGIPVTIDSLTGNFAGLNPQIRINGLSLLVGQDGLDSLDAEANAVEFESASLEIDIVSSLLQRQWVLADFVVENLGLDIVQTQQGGWQLSGFDISGGGTGGLNDFFDSILRVSSLSLRNVRISLLTREAERFSIVNGLATIQNQGRTHFVHINGNLQRNSRQIAISIELEGDRIEALDGQIHIELPTANYTGLLQGSEIAGISVGKLIGGGVLWLTLEDGQVSRVVTEAKVDSVTFLAELSSAISLQNVNGLVSLTHDLASGAWELAMADMSVTWEDHFWRPFNIYAYLLPNVSLSARADNIDLALVSEFVASGGYLGAEAQQQLVQYSPGGALENFSLYVPFAEAMDQHLLLKTNLSGTELGSVRGSPNMWGINGYLQVDYDNASRQLLGLAEVESDEFSINIPNLFTEVWGYSFVNGSLGFRADLSNGQEVKLVSGVIVAESAAVDGRAQFTSTMHSLPNGEREGSMELLVGAHRVDAEQVSLYLPDGSNIAESLRASMQWLDSAIIDGDVYDSGVIFRGSTVAGSDPATKTFQSFYLMNDGRLNFSNEWPDLEALSALVVTDDNKIDVEVISGRSLGVDLSSVQGEIRRNELGENWLVVQGSAAGQTSQGLNYLQQAPVGERLKNTFANWEAEGGFVADIGVRMPLSSPEEETAVRLDINIADNSITIPDYALSIAQLSGPVVFDTTAGLEESKLSGLLFDRSVDLTLSSQSIDGQLQSIIVNADGASEPDKLAEWPLQSEFVRGLLALTEGEIDFVAQLSIDQTGSGVASNRLAIDSTLIGASLNLPAPFAKNQSSSYPLHVELDFGAEQTVSGKFGSELNFNMVLQDGLVTDGVIFIGAESTNLAALTDSETDGLAIVGKLNRFELGQWTDFFAGLGSEANPAEGFSNGVAFVDVMIETFAFYGQELPDVGVRIEPEQNEQAWLTSLTSDSLQGLVTIPFQRDDYLQLDLDYLRLPGDKDEEAVIDDPDLVATRGSPRERERIDVLANIDPRTLPRMRFATDEFTIGSLPYGSFEFTLDPTNTGAEVSDLVFDFRGLRVGMEGPFVDGEEVDEYVARFQPRFAWNFDGAQHRSEFRAILYADNMADVLTANGYEASFESDNATFFTDISWPGSPAFFSASALSGEIDLDIEEGRFLQGSSGRGALRLISIINFNAIMRRLRFSDDLLRSGLAYDEITAEVNLENGVVTIEDRLVISGPSSLYQITGEIDLAQQTILGEMYVTLPVSDNIPWLGLLTANIPLAVGAYLFDRIFGNQVASLTSAVYTLQGPWEGLQPVFKQAFGSPNAAPVPGDITVQ